MKSKLILTLFSFIFVSVGNHLTFAQDQSSSSSATTVHNKDENHDVEELSDFSLIKPYLRNLFHIDHWDFNGAAYVREWDYVRVCPKLKSVNGRLWSKKPLQNDSFIIEFEYKIHSDSPTFSGDGLAFWITEDSIVPGPVFGAQNKWKGAAIIWDTYDNSHNGWQFTHIGLYLNDGTKSYDHFSDGKDLLQSSCDEDVRNSKSPTFARIKYVKNKYLSLDVGDKGTNSWKQCFKVNDVKLPQSKFIGFSGHTGDLDDNHDIHEVRAYAITKENVQIPDSHKESRYEFGFIDDTVATSSILITLTIVFIIVAAVVGFFAIDRSSRSKRF